MKLLILSASTSWGGLEKYAAIIAGAAVKHQWQTYIAFPAVARLNEYIQTLTANGVIYIPLKITQVKTHKTIKRFCKNLIRYLKTLLFLIKLRPTVVQIILPWPDQCVGSILACATLVVPTAVVFQLAPKKLVFSPKRLNLYKWAYYRRQAWVAVSKSNLQALCQTFAMSDSQFQCIYNGVAEPLDYPDSSQRDLLRLQVRNELNLSPETTIFITVGRLHPQKGYHLLIPVISKIRESFPDVKFIWCGETEAGYQEYLLKIFQQYPGTREAVVILGHRHDIQRLLYASDVFILPTSYEGLSFALLEAVSCGIPVIASDIETNCEILARGINVMLFRSGDEQDLFEKMRWALGHLIELKAIAQREHKLPESFTQTQMVEETIKLLESLQRRAKRKE